MLGLAFHKAMTVNHPCDDCGWRKVCMSGQACVAYKQALIEARVGQSTESWRELEREPVFDLRKLERKLSSQDEQYA